MNILILNWRDIKNTSSGGAEILTHEIAKRWVKKGHTVVLFSSFFKNALEQEIIDGVKIIRSGKADIRYLFASVHWHAFLRYNKDFKGKFDIVIDEIHGVPFFSPLYVREKKVVLICEIAGDLWIKMFGNIFGRFLKLIEQLILRNIYRSFSFLTISSSVREDLLKIGIKDKNITVLKMGMDFPSKKKTKKEGKELILLYLGRLSPLKGLDDAIEAFRLISLTNTQAKLWIIGRGDEEYEKTMKTYVKKINLHNKIVFYGYVPEDQKYDILSKGTVLIHPSKSEGWGINVIEANYMGVPAIGYSISGLKDSIQDGKTGLLTEENDPKSLVSAVNRIVSDKKLYDTLSSNAQEWAKSFSWESAGSNSLEVLEKIYEKK